MTKSNAGLGYRSVLAERTQIDADPLNGGVQDGFVLVTVATEKLAEIGHLLHPGGRKLLDQTAEPFDESAVFVGPLSVKADLLDRL